MKLDKIIELLGVEKLDEEIVNSIQEKLQEMVEAKAEVKASELVEGKIEKEKETLVENYENKFNKFKDDVLNNFSNFIDDILEEKLEIPQNIVEYARVGELYHDLVEQFKVRLAIDEGFIKEEVKDLLKEAKGEIETLREQKNSLTEKYLATKGDAQEFSAALYLYEKCNGLTESQKKHVFNILEGVKDKEIIDKKFNYIIESLGNSSSTSIEESVKIKVEDAKETAKILKELGVDAKAGKDDDVVIVANSDKEKLYDWMISDGGFSKEDIENEYPELVEKKNKGKGKSKVEKEKEDDENLDEDVNFVKFYANYL